MIDCRSKPVIFPKLAREWIVSKGRFILTGRKRADFKLLELLISFDDLPHCMVWHAEKKKWIECPNRSKLRIMGDVIVDYDYEKLITFDDALLLSWLNLYSSATFSYFNSREQKDFAALE